MATLIKTIDPIKTADLRSFFLTCFKVSCTNYRRNGSRRYLKDVEWSIYSSGWTPWLDNWLISQNLNFRALWKRSSPLKSVTKKKKKIPEQRLFLSDAHNDEQLSYVITLEGGKNGPAFLSWPHSGAQLWFLKHIQAFLPASSKPQSAYWCKLFKEHSGYISLKLLISSLK